MKTETVQFLVRLLETGLESQENPSAIKAQIVKAIKAMQLSLKYGEEVRWSTCNTYILLWAESYFALLCLLMFQGFKLVCHICDTRYNTHYNKHF